MKRTAFAFAAVIFFAMAHTASAALTLTAGSNATTTPNVATSITGFQIEGPSASTTPVKLRATNGTLNLSTVSGVTMSGNGSGTVNLSGTVEKLNQALTTLTYTRSSTGTDTLEVALVNSDQIYFSDNGHVYQYVAGTINWNNAKTAAEGLTAYGASGYLVTITTTAENNFVKARLSGDAWIGASDSGTEGTWKWVTGPESGTTFWQGTAGGSTVGGNYASWGGGEPNQSGDEDCGETYVASGTWNDLPCTATVSGYVAEFGSDASPATVVSANISIVTADVPALTSLFPANGATSATTTANLVLRFSKSVTKQTGNIVIYKSSDDSVVETIDVSGSQVSGSGTSVILIDPSATFAEGTQMYVKVPSTAFKDSSDNFFSGFMDETTWVFTTRDDNAPQITNLSSSVGTTTATVSWDTNENASTRLWYSASLSYASSTNEADTGTRVTSHEVSLSDLVGCTLYNYKAVSRDAALNAATSSAGTFTTRGCSGGATPSSATTTSVSVNAIATTTHSESGRVLTVVTPEDFTDEASSVVIQIKGLSADPVLDSIGIPDGLSSVASVVFDVTALIDNETVLDSFDTPVTISYQYDDADIAGLNESTLRMYHYASGAWSALNSCSVNTTTNVITCEAPHFSVFAIFGSPVSTGGNGGGGGTGSVKSQVRSLLGRGEVAKAQEIKDKWPQLFAVETSSGALSPTQTSVGTVRDLELGMTGEDVRQLQILLNTAGYSVAQEGIGSPGNETTYFGSLTKTALSKYQSINGIVPSVGYFGPRTRAHMSEWAVSGAWW